MKWRRGVGGGGIEDRRGSGLGGIPFPVGATGGGLGLVGILLAILFGGGVLGGGNGGTGVPGLDPFPSMPEASGQRLPGAPDPDARLQEFVAFVVHDVQQSWSREFARAGRAYEPTTLVLFSHVTNTGCGTASSDTGPFYCSADRHVYLDLGFFRELSDRFAAPGDFAQAYVIAHEFGHHVQNLLGISGQVEQQRQEHPDEANELSVRRELQADCFAGVWGHSAYEENLLESGDLEEGLRAAAAVGDDRLQQQATGHVNPETWTHGSSEQRSTWFRRGFEGGDPNACDTFSGDV